jgi:hypothetical protein
MIILHLQKLFLHGLVEMQELVKVMFIQVLLTLTSSWQQQNFVMVVAQMGIVVVNVEGQTIHATFNFNFHGKP